eukprot:TRINITY_DN1953_c0_g1_i3.p1 TRINITY_DN1953_c0_g1~~TRINITY_DN1953_c0_g1_i3.p1  ORF type:complete len:321 (+),score=56.02 TRINITY_DN1953_c0_g1_i3:34-996(+)
MAYSGTSPPGSIMLPPKSPKKHHTAPTYNQMHAGPPLPPNKPKVFVGQFETQKQEKSMPENSFPIQSIHLSINNSDVKERGQQTKDSKLGEKKVGEELRQLREEGKKLLKDNSFLSSKLEEQKKESDSQLDIYKREILTLREELDQEKGARARVEEGAAGERNQARITQLRLESQLQNIQPRRLDEGMQNIVWETLAAAGSPKQVTESPKPINYINIEPNQQFSECYIEYKELEKSKITLNKEKQKVEQETAKFLDLLHGEKIALTEELSLAKRQLIDSEKEIARLRHALSEATICPPLPSRSHKVATHFSNGNHYKSSA